MAWSTCENLKEEGRQRKWSPGAEFANPRSAAAAKPASAFVADGSKVVVGKPCRSEANRLIAFAAWLAVRIPVLGLVMARLLKRLAAFIDSMLAN